MTLKIQKPYLRISAFYLPERIKLIKLEYPEMFHYHSRRYAESYVKFEGFR